jgi:hypothetical protein
MGSITAPIKATAGEGQKNHEIIIIKIPMTQYANAGLFISFVNGDIINSLIPVFASIVLIATITEIINIVPISSTIAYIKLLNTVIILLESELVATNARRNMPTIQTNVVSLFLIITANIKRVNTR